MRKVLREGGESFIRSNPILPFCSCAYEKSSYAKVASLLLGLTQSFPYTSALMRKVLREGGESFIRSNPILPLYSCAYENSS